MNRGKSLTLLLLGSAVALSVAACGDGKVKRGCKDGMVLDEERHVCVEPKPSCSAGNDGGVSELVGMCNQQHRTCEEAESGARCGVCMDGFVETDKQCKAVATCMDLGCDQKNRGCTPEGTHSNAVCTECADGLLDLDGTCAQLNCDPIGVPGSMTAECAKQNRACVAKNGSAMCAGCAVGFVEDGDTCIKALDCEALACTAAGRDCEAGKPGEHSRCTNCLPGYQLLAGACVRDEDTVCAGTSTAPENIEDDCLKRNQLCVAKPGSGALCGECIANSVELSDGTCVPKGSCAAIDCASQNRDCTETPTGMCTDCLPGFVEDAQSGKCRATKKCADLTCAPKEECQEASSYADAECHGACGERALWNGRRCEPCPACTAPGEVKRWPWPTAEGNCICETKPGYYYSIAGDVGPFLCDADKDGWVRESGRIALESTDPNIKTNARCELRSIDRILLENQFGEVRGEKLQRALALYETDRNDDDRILKAYWIALNLPAYGSGQQLATAAQLNRFTKYCGGRLGDYNDNGVPDVGEWGAEQRGPLMRPEQVPFNTFSYFAELHTGGYEAPASGDGPGSYRVRERSRLTEANANGKTLIPLGYGAATDEAWRTCRVLRDAKYKLQDPPVGMDFSDFYDAPAGSSAAWSGMWHHSQFKCVIIEADPDPAAPQEKSIASLLNAKHVLSRCELKKADGAATAEPVCTAIDTSNAKLGEALWASVAYRFHEGFPVDDDGDNVADCLALEPLAKDCTGPTRPVGSTNFVYEHGCINECVAGVRDCPGWDTNHDAVSCSAGDFGEKTGQSCDAWELCDGKDNDADSHVDDIIDENTKQRDESLLSRDLRVGVNVACDVPNSHGICTAGRMQCVRSVDAPPNIIAAPACVYVIQPGSTLEICDGLDQDCDGTADEQFVDPNTNLVQEGTACLAPGLLGECAKGSYQCEANAQGQKTTVCHPFAYTPVAETCNSKDDDCNGQIDDVPSTTVPTNGCPATFTQYFRDQDNDGYVSAVDAKCACSTPAGYRTKIFPWFDCCDTDSGAYPFEPNWKTVATACGHWDWDCSDPISRQGQKRYTELGTNSGCSWDWADAECSGGSYGWENTVAACGETGNTFNSCSYVFGGCNRSTSKLTQECK